MAAEARVSWVGYIYLQLQSSGGFVSALFSKMSRGVVAFPPHRSGSRNLLALVCLWQLRKLMMKREWDAMS